MNENEAPFNGEWKPGEEHESMKKFKSDFGLELVLNHGLGSDHRKVKKFILWLTDQFKCWPHPDTEARSDYPEYTRRSYAKMKEEAENGR